MAVNFRGRLANLSEVGRISVSAVLAVSMSSFCFPLLLSVCLLFASLSMRAFGRPTLDLHRCG